MPRMSAVLICLFLSAHVEGFQEKKQDALGEFSRSVRALTERISPAVVQILVSGYGPVEEGEGQQVALFARQHSTGSGVVVDPDGYIITNAHVVRGAVSVRVLLAGLNKGSSKMPPADVVAEAKIIGIDRGTDLALIKIDKTGLSTLPFGDSDALQQGDIVLAIGSPLGLKNSVSMGVVSAPARQIGEDSPVAYIQTDASINPGNSGGALVTADGRLVGINSFIFTQSGGSQGIGFAMPSNIAQNVYQQLKAKGHVHRGVIGVFVQDITPILAAGLQLPRPTGVLVSDVEPEGPADSAGLKQKDIVLALDGHPMYYARDFDLAFYRRMKGDKVKLNLLRDGKELSAAITIEVAEEEGDDDVLADAVQPERNLIPRLGILCIEIDNRLAKLAGDLREKSGLVVAAKSPQGQGRYIDLETGDVIHQINDQAVNSLKGFQTTISNLKSGDPVALFIERSGTLRYVAFEIE